MHPFTKSPFYPDHQTMRGTVLALPHSLVQQTAVKPADETKELYSFTVDYDNNTQGLSDIKHLPVYQSYQETYK